MMHPPIHGLGLLFAAAGCLLVGNAALLQLATLTVLRVAPLELSSLQGGQLAPAIRPDNEEAAEPEKGDCDGAGCSNQSAASASIHNAPPSTDREHGRDGAIASAANAS